MSTLDLPSAGAIDAAVSRLSEHATPAAQRALAKAQYHLHRGVNIVATLGGLLIPSSKGDAIYKVAADGNCTCPASGVCWHQQVQEIVIEAQSRPTMPRMTKSHAMVLAEMDELF